jgi:hypothetical protein
LFFYPSSPPSDPGISSQLSRRGELKMINKNYFNNVESLLTSFEIILRSYLPDPDGQCSYQGNFDVDSWMNHFSQYYKMKNTLIWLLFEHYVENTYPNKYVLTADDKLFYSPTHKVLGRYI